MLWEKPLEQRLPGFVPRQLELVRDDTNAKKENSGAVTIAEQELKEEVHGLISLMAECIADEKARGYTVAEKPTESIFELHSMSKENVVGALPNEIENIIAVLANPEEFKALGLKDTPVGVILRGPPGTGKTMLAKLIASLTKRPMTHEFSSSFITSFQGSGALRMRSVFENARKQGKPAIIFLDEIDGLANSELKGSEGEAVRTVHEMHKQLAIPHDHHIFVIMATNKFEQIPEALKDRFANHLVTIGLPEWPKRRALLKECAARMNQPVSQDLLRSLADATEGLSCRVIENIANQALIQAGRANLALAETERANTVFSVLPKDFYVATYAAQKTRLPDAERRQMLIKFHLKDVEWVQNDDQLVIFIKETDGWDAEKIELWIELGMALAYARGSEKALQDDLLIAASLIEKEKAPARIRRRLLFTHFLSGKQVQDFSSFRGASA